MPLRTPDQIRRRIQPERLPSLGRNKADALVASVFCFAPRAPSLALKCEGQNLHFSHIFKAFNNAIFGDVTEPENSNVYELVFDWQNE